jgi:hypothetical protein
MWDNFWKVVIFVAVVCALSTCSGCFGSGTKSDSSLVDDMAENCKFSMKRGSVKQEGDEKETVVDCMPPGYGI